MEQDNGQEDVTNADIYDDSEALLDTTNVDTAIFKKEIVGGLQFGRSKVYSMTVLIATIIFMFADQNLLAPNLSAVATDFGFSKAERDRKLGGELSAAFFLVGAPSSLIIGYLSDITTNRVFLFTMVVLVGEAPCLATYWVQNYTQLVIVRAMTGISVGGVLPLLYSIVGDLFSAKHRSIVSACLATAAGIGVALGQAIAGFVGPTYGWRIPFMVVSVPTILFAIVAGCTVEDQKRGANEDEIKDLVDVTEYKERIDSTKLLAIFRNRTNTLVFLQGLPGCIPWGVMFAFFNDFLHDDKGLSVETSTGVTLWFGVGAAVGNIAGGVLGQYLYNKRKSSLSILMGVTTILGVVPLCLVINSEEDFLSKTGGQMYATFCVLIAGMLTCVTGANVRVLLLNVNVPEVRGTVFSVFNLSDDLGKGLGPFAVSSLILMLGRVQAFNVAMLMWLVTGVLLLLTGLTISSDVITMKKHLQEVAMIMHDAQENEHDANIFIL